MPWLRASSATGLYVKSFSIRILKGIARTFCGVWNLSRMFWVGASPGPCALNENDE